MMLSEEQPPAQTESPASPPLQAPPERERPKLGPVGMQTFKLSLVLALVLEVMLIVASAAFGHDLTLRATVLDLVQRLVWAPVLCIGLALILTMTRDHPLVTAISGLLIAPFASLLAHAAVEGVHALAFSGSALAGPSPWLLALMRGLEYACLGGIVCWVQSRGNGTATAHSAAGFVTGLVFGTAQQLVTARTAELASLYGFLAWAINEIFFPVGCGLILYRSQEAVEEVAEQEAKAAEAAT